MTTNSKLSVHWNPVHNRPGDLDFIRRLQPRSVKIINPDVQQVSDVFAAVPGTLIVLRDHAKSEQKDDMRNAPGATGHRHGTEWRSQVDNFRRQAQERGLPFPGDNQLVVLGINEPEVWSVLTQTVLYTVAFLAECTQRGLRAGALNLSVGWPANTGPDTPPDWRPYAPVEAVIRPGGHFLFLHSYWSKSGPQDMWGWWAGRYMKCPWNVPILIGECGIDQHVAQNLGEQFDQRGWRGYLKPSEYVAQLAWYDKQLLADYRIHSAQIYTTDGGREWTSFDTSPAHDDLVSYAATVQATSTPTPPPVAPPVVQGPVPSVTELVPFAARVIAPDGLNVRAKPGIVEGNMPLYALPFGGIVVVTGQTEAQTINWYRLKDNEWVAAVWLTRASDEELNQPVEPTPTAPPAPIPTGIIDPQVAAALIAVESGGQAFGPGGRLLIRFESHIFRGKLGDDNLFWRHFHYNEAKPWTEQTWRADGAAGNWQPIHTGKQADEWKAFEFADTLNAKAALESISMGAPQIMAFNHARIGYPSAEAMFKAFSASEAAQIIGLVNFWLSDPELTAAIRRKDWAEIGRRYNGAESAGKLYEAAYNRILKETS